MLTQSAGTWSRSGNNLTVSVLSAGLTETFEVVSVTGTELKLKVTTTQSGITITVNQSFIKA